MHLYMYIYIYVISKRGVLPGNSDLHRSHLRNIPRIEGEELAPEWSKGVFRRGVALRGLKRYDMAISAFAQGLEQDTW